MDEFPTFRSPTDDPQVYRLDQLSDEQFWEYARTLAKGTSLTPLTQEYLECVLSNGCCLVPLAALDEVVLSPQRFTLLPTSPYWMSGLAAWHGETIAVIDLDAYLSQHPASARATEGMVLIAHSESITLGLLVSAIGRTFPMKEVALVKDPAALPSWYMSSRAMFVKGMVEDAIMLDIPLLLAKTVKDIEITTSYGR